MNQPNAHENNTMHKAPATRKDQEKTTASIRGTSRPRPVSRRGLQRTESVADGTGIQKVRRCQTFLEDRASRSPRRRRSTPRRASSLASHLSVPKHHTMAPRRSSFKKQKTSELGGRSKKLPTRSVSFGNNAVSEVPKPPKEVKNDIWYDRRELGLLRYKTGKLVKKGPSDLNESSEDCWRGLETFARQEEERKADIVSDMEQYKLILLVLQKQNCDDLQLLQQQFLSRFIEQGTEAAAQDAAEAFAIYAETMDTEQVREFFSSSNSSAREAPAASEESSASVSAPSRAKSDHARVA